MRLWCVFRKSLREQLRELWLLSLVLSLAPFFVVLFYLVFGGGTWSYRVVVVDHDQPAKLADGRLYRGGPELLAVLVAARNAAGGSALRVLTAGDRSHAERLLLSGEAHALIEIPEGFSRAIAAAREKRPAGQPAELVYMGDMTSTSYMVAAVLAITQVSSYLESVTEVRFPVTLVEKPLGGSGTRSELDLAIPGLFVLAIILLIFPVAMSLARESESGCLRRLQLTRLTSFDLLGGLSLVQVLVGVVAVLCAFGTAHLVGFRSQGPLWAAIAISAVGSFAMIGVGLLVACFSRSVTEAFLLGNFPMMLLMFFSGAMIPIPKVPIFSIGAVTVGLWDWLPATHAVSAMNKVLGIGLGIGAVWYELVSLVILSALYFFAGVWLFKRRRMRAS
ncbi:MAG: ABC transporter permease [Candidatus Schekmanbacteria bacterium]|nr:ABC transporter permease [Candidatus Schekmanbacteria bacterium]